MAQNSEDPQRRMRSGIPPSRDLWEMQATALIAAMKKAHPEKSIRTLSYGVNGLTSRNNVQRMVKLKHEQKGAPVYQYHFTWQSPMLEDAGAWHTAELAFCFTIRSGANRARATR